MLNVHKRNAITFLPYNRPVELNISSQDVIAQMLNGVTTQKQKQKEQRSNLKADFFLLEMQNYSLHFISYFGVLRCKMILFFLPLSLSYLP